MRILQNTLYVTSPESYLALDGENIVILREEKEVVRLPLHNLEGVVAFGYTGASPALMGACAEKGIALSFLTPSGYFLARVTGGQQGNILLRKTQYRISDREEESVQIARLMIAAKLYNCHSVLERATRDYELRLDTETLHGTAQYLLKKAQEAQNVTQLDSLRGLEGEAAQQYFAVFDQLILQQKETFCFTGRTRRPPLDNINALLSFVYTLLAHELAAALESVGLDPYAGFLHRDRPGRVSLALDLMEELRAPMGDRFVLSLINKRMVTGKGFRRRENGAVMIDDETKKIIITAWQNRKQEELQHPFLQEKLSWGLVPYAQALLLSRYLRGDLEAYPPFFWK